MPFTILRQDITKMEVDAIVNAANNELTMGGGVCGTIFNAAGRMQLIEACRRLAPIPTGTAVITPGFNLPARFIIHAAGPKYHDGQHHESDLLREAYLNSLSLAVEHGLSSIAFPLISSGIYGFPKGQALKIAMDTIKDFLKTHDLDVTLVIYDKDSFDVTTALIGKIEAFIEDYLILPDKRRSYNNYERTMMNETEADRPFRLETQQERPLEYWIDDLDESFSTTLLKLIDQKGKTDVEVYKKANLDRKLFSKIRSNVNYCPSKPTAIALAIALELTLSETQSLLGKAGFALSHSSKSDLIIEYCIRHQIYDIYMINEVLFKYDQALLGA